MKLKYITKPVLINFLRYLDKNKILFPFRICYSSFRSKKDMLKDLLAFFDVTDHDTRYIFTLKSRFGFLVCPPTLYFCKETFAFQNAECEELDLQQRPSPPKFQILRGPFLVQI